jgi:Raf kinase inhibitor-like YbhB/YbcL family protein
MKITSPAFSHGDSIPVRFTCEGENVSPELHWTDAPPETKSFALILHDPDAPRPGSFTHWVVYDVPSGVHQIPEGAPQSASLPGGLQGNNDGGKVGYVGPCPPSGRHRYFFRLFALRAALDLQSGATAAEVQHAMEGKIVAQAELMGTYQKSAGRAA